MKTSEKSHNPNSDGHQPDSFHAWNMELQNVIIEVYTRFNQIWNVPLLYWRLFREITGEI